jgi:glycosyltransferase involved in cell wall biosynthesis
MKVLHLIKTSVGATWALRQMQALVKLGVEVHVALPPGPLVPAYQAAGVVVHLLQTDLPVRTPWTWFGLAATLRQLVATVNPALIHSHFVGTTLTMRLALGKAHPVPRVFQVPGPLHLEHPLFRQVELGTAGRADYWIGSCCWTCARYCHAGVGAERVFLSYYGIDLDTFISHDRGVLRAELGVDMDTKLVGMVAYMYPPKRYLGQQRGLKGHEDLIDAMAICVRSDPNLRCVFVGGAWGNAARYERQVRRYAAQRLGAHAVFLGTRADVARLYPDFDVVVHPSHSENVGGAAESLLLAVPTIATNVGGFPDVVQPGKTGWLVPPKQPVQLAHAILDALHDPARAQAHAQHGQARTRTLFDVRETARHLVTMYETIIHSHAGLHHAR